MWIYNVSGCVCCSQFLFLCRFDIEAINVIRHYIPDIAVFVLSLISGLFLLVIVIMEKKVKKKKVEEKLSLQPHRSNVLHEISPSPEADTNANLISSSALATSDPNVLHRLESTELPLVSAVSPDPVKGFGTKIEKSKWRKHKLKVFAKLPIAFLLSISWRSLYIVFLWSSGVCVASVLNFVYFICSIFLGLCWALHLNQIRIFVVAQKIITVLVSLYSAIHLILLYLYQFQSAQELVPRSSLTTRCVCLYVCLSLNCVCVCCVNAVHVLWYIFFIVYSCVCVALPVTVCVCLSYVWKIAGKTCYHISF